MTKNLLIELGLEEMPAYVVTSSMQQLGDKLAQFLENNRLTFEEIELFSTPRRLAARITQLSEVQPDLTEDFKGPSKKIALDAEGHFTKAAQGFVRGKGLTVDDIEFREVKGEEYVYVTKEEKGKSAEEVLEEGLADVLMSLSFPVSMHWANHRFEYIRPVHTLLVLLDEKALSVDFLDIHSARVSRGHRFLGKEVEIAHATSYEEDLKAQFVLANPLEREERIKEQIRSLEVLHNVTIEIDAKLLNEVLNLVEYPTAFMGDFDARYLEVPEEVLITSMKEHQRYFVVRDKAGHLLPHFVSVRNGDGAHLENVKKGNEKVLVARLEDAVFFWQEDQKLKIADLVDKLKQVTFHEKIGSLFEHMERTKAIARLLSDKLGLSNQEQADLERAASIYKFDLLTGMVGEFDELQGVMGEKYALLAGENPVVAQAIREHYLPNASEGLLPESKVGAVLALADKLDTILSFFSVGLIPSGSNDPYALRRATQGVLRILEAFDWSLDINALLQELYEEKEIGFDATHQQEVFDFFQARLEKMMDPTIPTDIVTAVLARSSLKIGEVLETARLLAEKSQEAAFKPSVESLARVFNLAEKAMENQVIDPNLFENEAEKNLYIALEQLDLTGMLSEQIDQLFTLQPVITAFFEKTMVMTEEEALRNNRLALLAAVMKKAQTIAQFNQMNTK